MRIYGRNLSKEVVVELPCGSTWKMGLKNGVGATNGIVWLDDGWREFANHYSLKRGHLLVFRYEGNSKFHVVICDITICDIDYPSNPVQRNEPNNTNREKQHFKRKQTEEDNFQSNKKARAGPCGETQSDSLSPRSKGSQCNELKNFPCYSKVLSFELNKLLFYFYPFIFPLLKLVQGNKLLLTKAMEKNLSLQERASLMSSEGWRD